MSTAASWMPAVLRRQLAAAACTPAFSTAVGYPCELFARPNPPLRYTQVQFSHPTCFATVPLPQCCSPAESDSALSLALPPQVFRPAAMAVLRTSFYWFDECSTVCKLRWHRAGQIHRSQERMRAKQRKQGDAFAAGCTTATAGSLLGALAKRHGL